MHAIEQFLTTMAQTVPLEIFVIVGSFLEEVIAPIPSPSIMVVAGSFGLVQGYTVSGLMLLVLFASVGKTLGGLTMYYLAAKIKDVAMPFFQRFIDVTDADIERLSAQFTGSWKDYFVYVFFRAVPIIPSILLSFGSGVLSLPLRLFIIGTFLGTVVRDSFYLFVGYKGTTVLEHYLKSTSMTESLLEYLVLGAIGIAFIYLLIRKRRRSAQARYKKTPPL